MPRSDIREASPALIIVSVTALFSGPVLGADERAWSRPGSGSAGAGDAGKLSAGVREAIRSAGGENGSRTEPARKLVNAYGIYSGGGAGEGLGSAPPGSPVRPPGLATIEFGVERVAGRSLRAGGIAAALKVPEVGVGGGTDDTTGRRPRARWCSGDREDRNQPRK
jgi:hypothetical protein